MRTAKVSSRWLIVLFALLLNNCTAASMQSLADVARQEAERRKLLEQQGIEAKVIKGNAEHLASDGNVTVSSPDYGAPERALSQSISQKNHNSVHSYRNELQKLDRTIRQDEERLQLLQARLQADRWAIPKVGRVSRRKSNTDEQSRTQTKIDELQRKLKRLRQERAEVYEAGKKAGFQPGELENKGIIP